MSYVLHDLLLAIGEDLGAVECTDVPLADVPPHLAEARYSISLDRQNFKLFDSRF